MWVCVWGNHKKREEKRTLLVLREKYRQIVVNEGRHPALSGNSSSCYIHWEGTQAGNKIKTS